MRFGHLVEVAEARLLSHAPRVNVRFGWKVDIPSGNIGRMSGDAIMLQFDWEDVDGAPVTAVVAKGACALSDGSLACEEVAFVLGQRAVVLRVNDDTDEVTVSLEPFAIDSPGWRPLDQLGEIVSRSLGWCWEGRNYRGFLDTFTLAIDGIDPAYSFTGMASSLRCARVVSIAA